MEAHSIGGRYLQTGAGPVQRQHDVAYGVEGRAWLGFDHREHKRLAARLTVAADVFADEHHGRTRAVPVSTTEPAGLL